MHIEVHRCKIELLAVLMSIQEPGISNQYQLSPAGYFLCSASVLISISSDDMEHNRLKIVNFNSEKFNRAKFLNSEHWEKGHFSDTASVNSGYFLDKGTKASEHLRFERGHVPVGSLISAPMRVITPRDRLATNVIMLGVSIYIVCVRVCVYACVWSIDQAMRDHLRPERCVICDYKKSSCSIRRVNLAVRAISGSHSKWPNKIPAVPL